MLTSREDLQKKLSNAGMSAIAAEVVDLCREAFRIQVSASNDHSLPVAASKLGGLPDLPATTAWPIDGATPLSFVGQINLGDLPTASMLPKDGLLSFFYDSEQHAWGFDPKHKSLFRVFYFSAPTKLQRASLSHATFKTRVLTFEPFLSIPDPSAKRIEDLLVEVESDEIYGEFFEAYCPQAPDHQLLGWPAVIQNEMELECQLVTHGLYVGGSSGYKDPRRKELEKDAQDWILLFQVDSDDDANMMWGDQGRLYFWIRRQDLQLADFANAWCILQCY